MNLCVGLAFLLCAFMLREDSVHGGEVKKENNPAWYWTTTGRPYTTDGPGPGPRFDHVRRLNNMEFQFEKLSRNVAKILQIIQHIPSITGVGEILKEVQQIPQIKKILTGAVIRFPSPQYGDENAVRYYVQGHVEILHDNQWGTICDDSFDDSSDWEKEQKGKTCTGIGIYTRGEGGCDGWSRTSLEKCMQYCKEGRLPQKCKLSTKPECQYVVWDDNRDWAPGWCQLASSCTLTGSSSGVVVKRRKGYSGDKNANVLCRMGGYKSGVYHWGRYKQRHAPKAQRIWLDDVYCSSGNETSIGNCNLYNGWGYNNCNHNEDVGIRCYI